mgnify:CR=1 FL=1
MIKAKNVDVLILGSGLAGKLSAILLYNKFAGDIKISVITNSIENNSMLAQGGVAISTEVNDIESHITDTMNAGKWENDLFSVNEIIKNSAKSIEVLNHIGFDFYKVDGQYQKRLEGGHSKNRIYYKTDRTGFEIMKSIDSFFNDCKIEILEYQQPLKLLKKNNKCVGAVVYDGYNNKTSLIYSKSTIVATGGISGLFERRTGTEFNIGGGISLANEIDATISNMNYIQFHPTAYFSNDNTTFLITEAIRGEGAKLLNEDEVYFLKGKLDKEELAPRDMLSEAIYNEIYINKKRVYLDCRNIGEMELKFPSIFQYFKNKNIDMNIDLIPIAPAAHYLCGGIDIDLNCRTNIENLYAIGECSNSGLHGANRLASNSLMEILVLTNNLAHSIDLDINETENETEKIIFNYYDITDEECNQILKEFNLHFNVVKNLDGLEEIVRKINKVQILSLNYTQDIDIKAIRRNTILRNIVEISKEQLKLKKK